METSTEEIKEPSTISEDTLIPVKFNKEIDHWFYSNNKPNIFDSIVSLDSLKNKINNANG